MAFNASVATSKYLPVAWWMKMWPFLGSRLSNAISSKRPAGTCSPSAERIGFTGTRKPRSSIKVPRIGSFRIGTSHYFMAAAGALSSHAAKRAISEKGGGVIA